MNMTEVEYRILEQDYIELMQNRAEYKNLDDLTCMRVLFPNQWFHCMAYEKKIEILKQAIEQNVRVTQIPESLDFEEGVRHTK